MKYVIGAEYANAKITTEVNDVDVMLNVAENHRDCNHLCVYSGETGEVLMHTGDEPYCTREFALMRLGWAVAQLV